ncbi:hypothetical protein [Cellulosimicrobium sp. JZ28]|uniref:hypothetical protein n=1 Tax=Cellulosimicrobium sp. JZ28 TaxID=1906273 RepID=UPI00188AA3CF|nr:hypothetical protein [Cellulosimicrobium sp. JZ28]
MTDQDWRLARHVAEAADAWLRDPLDAGVYRRLVDATLAWRAGGGRVVQGLPAPGAVPGASPGDGPTAPPRPTVGTPDDDERYLRPDRAPRAVGSTLADVASLLRARAGAADAGDTADVADTADDERP